MAPHSLPSSAMPADAHSPNGTASPPLPANGAPPRAKNTAGGFIVQKFGGEPPCVRRRAR